MKCICFRWVHSTKQLDVLVSPSMPVQISTRPVVEYDDGAHWVPEVQNVGGDKLLQNTEMGSEVYSVCKG